MNKQNKISSLTISYPVRMRPMSIQTPIVRIKMNSDNQPNRDYKMRKNHTHILTRIPIHIHMIAILRKTRLLLLKPMQIRNLIRP